MRVAIAITMVLGVSLGAYSDGTSTLDWELNERYAFIGLPDRSRSMLRYSTIEDVMASLGEPEEREYYAQGADDFLWVDFYVATYRDGNLWFHYDGSDGRIIRITVNINILRGLTLPFGIDSDTAFSDLPEIPSKSPGITEVYEDQGVFLYHVGPWNRHLGNAIYSDPDGSGTWFDTLYEAPWD